MVLRFAYHPSPPIFHLSKLRTNDSVGWKRCIDKSWQVCVVFDLITPSAISCLQGLNISQTSVRCCVQPINIVLQTARLNWWYLMSAFYFIHIGFETSEKELKRMNAVTTRIKKKLKREKVIRKKKKKQNVRIQWFGKKRKLLKFIGIFPAYLLANSSNFWLQLFQTTMHRVISWCVAACEIRGQNIVRVLSVVEIFWRDLFFLKKGFLFTKQFN